MGFLCCWGKKYFLLSLNNCSYSSQYLVPDSILQSACFGCQRGSGKKHLERWVCLWLLWGKKKKQGQWISSGNLNLCLICVCWSPAGSSAQVCHVGDRGPTTWGITCCLLGCNGGKLESEARAGIETEMGYRPLMRYCWTRQPCWQTSWYIP